MSDNWQQLGQVIYGETEEDIAGAMISLNSNGNTVAISSIRNDGNSSNIEDNRGSVRVYDLSNNSLWVQRGQDIDGEHRGETFGSSVSLSADGNILAIGAYNFQTDASNVYTRNGRVCIFKFNNNTSTWIKQGQDIIGEVSEDNFGNDVSLSADGNIVAIGAPSNDDGSNNNIGSVYVYEFNNSLSTWVKQGQTIYGETSGDNSGETISLSADGTTVAIGSYRNDGANTSNTNDDRGSTRVYKFNSSNNNWVKYGQDIDGESSEDNSGFSISLSENGNTIAIGAPFNDGSNNNITSDNRGSTRIYDISNNIWIQRGQDIDGQESQGFSGAVVSLSGNGNRVIIGAPFKNNTIGGARIYNWNNSNSLWVQSGADFDGISFDRFATAVAISTDGNVVAIGAPGVDLNSENPNVGTVSLFKLQPPPPPTIIDISYNTTTLTNISLVTITGTTFTSSTSLSFAGITVTPINITNNTITCRLPLGTGSIVVTTEYGSSEPSTSYTVSRAVPIIIDVSYNTTILNIDSLVTITGDNFTENTLLSFAGINVIPISISINTIICQLPLGTGNIFVSTLDGSYTFNNSYTVIIRPPTIIDISYNTSTLTNTSFVFITGTNFTSNASLSFAGVNVTPIYVGNNLIICNLPLGTGFISVTTIGGSDSYITSYTVSRPPPIITDISYNTEVLTNSSFVVITGTNFTSDASLSFAGINVIPIYNSDNVIICNLHVGTGHITINTLHGEVTSISSYTVLPRPPTITNISYNTLTLTNDSVVIITGTNFTSDTLLTFMENNVIPDFINNTTIICNLPVGTGYITVTTTDGTATSTNTYTVLTPIDAEICFLANTPIITDQGLIEIQKINPEKNTIRGKKIVAVTETITRDKYLVCFEKDSLGPNLPSKETIMSQNHCVFYKGEMIEAKRFLYKFENIKRVKYNGEYLYNVLLENHDKMIVNNLVCETLSPKNKVAVLYKYLNKALPEEKDALIQDFNNYGKVLKSKI